MGSIQTPHHEDITQQLAWAKKGSMDTAGSWAGEAEIGWVRRKVNKFRRFDQDDESSFYQRDLDF